jgi:uncharacterized protein GlcG (DUF336 family)
MKKALLAGVAACLFSSGALAANATCPAVSNTQLATALKNAVTATNGALGLNLNMWATVVAADGRVCAVANSSGNAIQGQWLASRVISAQKAFAAATLSLSGGNGNLALSTANLYTATQPGGSLYGLQHSNPVWSAAAYGDKINSSGAYVGPGDTALYGTTSDPMIGLVIGGINVFGGGLALYTSPTAKVGGIGVSGDTSCTDHLVAWRTRANLGLDHLKGVGGVGPDANHPDNIVFDITPQGGQMPGISTGGFGHPTCLNNTQAASTSAAAALPNVQP